MISRPSHSEWNQISFSYTPYIQNRSTHIQCKSRTHSEWTILNSWDSD